MKRRKFVQTTSAILATASILPQMNGNPISPKPSKNIKTILFQGDSITDAGRDRKVHKANHSSALGKGYAFLASASILENYPELQPQIYNKGISGNKVNQLIDRWGEDAIDIKPDLVSILIGVNDHWHTINGKYNGTIDIYRNDYKALLTQTKDTLGDVKLIIGEPFILKGGTAIDLKKWLPIFDEYRATAKALASEFKAEFIPYQSIFDKAMKTAPVSYWAPDGVHPSIAGAQLMASHWMKAFKKCV
ncbi:SGNH/GDSL hydrolase family protein [Membranihabitans marinus]|uniref:SGNH/GDSL hydrolase family protein n=1 Tax=Membranihabitans marinus TaxID=1227546 RepID=UPI001F3A849A|nr:SGNH/GDSL hydrolase family protein [Membranihabitans marinus]